MFLTQWEEWNTIGALMQLVLTLKDGSNKAFSTPNLHSSSQLFR